MPRARVLIADDFEEMRWLVGHALSQHFTIVGSVADGRTLVNAAKSLHPQVIVSDICMPSLTGPEAIRELRSSGLNIPFVLMSTNMRDANAYIDVGALGLIDKMDIGHELLPAVWAASIGQTYLSRHVRSLSAQDSHIYEEPLCQMVMNTQC